MARFLVFTGRPAGVLLDLIQPTLSMLHFLPKLYLINLQDFNVYHAHNYEPRHVISNNVVL